jgi:hypothetical protein
MATISVQPLHRETPYLSDDMTRSDIVEVLQHLPWHGQNGTAVVRLDRGVADYLLRLLSER